MKKSFYLFFLITTFLLSACEPVETGSVYIVSPSLWPTVVRDDPLPFYYIVLNSSYQDSKILEISNNNSDPITCFIGSGEQNKTCPVPITTPGDQNIIINVPLKNGTKVALHTAFQWLPYTELDKQMQFGIFKVPAWGYVAIFLLTIITLFIALVLITGKNYELSSIVATFFSVVVIINSYFLPSFDQAIKAGYCIYPVLAIFLSLTIKLKYYYKPTLVIIEGDGKKISYVSKPPPGLQARYQEIKISEINKDLYLDTSKKKEE